MYGRLSRRDEKKYSEGRNVEVVGIGKVGDVKEKCVCMNTPRSSKLRITSEFAVIIFIDVSFSKLFVIIHTLIIALETTYRVPGYTTWAYIIRYPFGKMEDT